MQPTKVDKMHSPKGYNKVMPPTNQTPGSRTTGSHGSGKMYRTDATDGKGNFSGSPPGVSAGCDWGSPHRTSRIPSTGRDK